jgi:hypothetical protein
VENFKFTQSLTLLSLDQGTPTRVGDLSERVHLSRKWKSLNLTMTVYLSFTLLSLKF